MIEKSYRIYLTKSEKKAERICRDLCIDGARHLARCVSWNVSRGIVRYIDGRIPSIYQGYYYVMLEFRRIGFLPTYELHLC